RRLGVCARWDVTHPAIDVAVEVEADRSARFLGEVAEQTRGAGKQRDAAHGLDREAEVGQRRAADASTVERQRSAEYLRMHAPDGFEQREVRAIRAAVARQA